MVQSGKVKKNSMKLNFCGSMDFIKNDEKSNNVLSFPKHKGKKKKRYHQLSVSSKLTKRNFENCKEEQLKTNIKKRKGKHKKMNPLLVKRNSKLDKGNLEYCKEEQLETRISANTNNSQSKPTVDKSDEEAWIILNSQQKVKTKKQLTKVSSTGLHNDTVSRISNESEDKTLCKADVVEPSRDSVSDLSADESDCSVSSFSMDSYPSDSESNLSANESNNNFSFHIDNYPSDDEGEEHDTYKKNGIPLNTVPSAELEERESRTIFVGNLPKTVERHELQKWFSRFGNIDCVRLRSAPIADLEMPRKVAVIKKSFHDNRSNIHAYIRYKDIEGALNALQANGIRFCDHTLRVDLARHEGGYDAKKAVFVGNLSFCIEEESLIALFLKCGEIESVRVVRDKDTGVGKGFAFVNFKCSSSVPLALKLDGEVLEKRQLRVKIFKHNQKTNNHHLSSNLKIKMNKPVFSKGKFRLKEGHIKDETGEKKKSVSYQKPRQQKGKIQRGNKFIDQRSFGKSKVKENQFQGEFSKRKQNKTLKRKSRVAKKYEIFSKILLKKKKD